MICLIESEDITNGNEKHQFQKVIVNLAFWQVHRMSWKGILRMHTKSSLKAIIKKINRFKKLKNKVDQNCCFGGGKVVKPLKKSSHIKWDLYFNCCNHTYTTTKQHISTLIQLTPWIMVICVSSGNSFYFSRIASLSLSNSIEVDCVDCTVGDWVVFFIMMTMLSNKSFPSLMVLYLFLLT